MCQEKEELEDSLALGITQKRKYLGTILRRVKKD